MFMRDKIFLNSDPLSISMTHPMLLLFHVYVRDSFVLCRCKIPLIDGNSKNVNGLGEAEGGGNRKLE